MFAYSDPVGSGILEAHSALSEYRTVVHGFYRQFGILPQSAFTLLEAFDDVPTDTAQVQWIAFPRSAKAPDLDIDRNRYTGGSGHIGYQDEYVEWLVERDANGEITRITFTTEFPEYYEALAGIGKEAVIAGVADAIPGPNPTPSELFGASFDADSAMSGARQRQFIQHLPDNPWQNGRKGILCLQQRFNSLGALFNLVGRCAILLPGSSTSACSNASNASKGACGHDRNSDPAVCTAAQEIRRKNRVLSLEDPVGIRLLQLGGIWKFDGRQIDINDPNQNRGTWTITRNGRRARLNVSTALTFGDDKVVSGAQVARVLRVGVGVISAPETAVPPWARTGQESTRQIV
jgi:hypothetical protein